MTRKELERLRGDVDRELVRSIERDKKAAMAAAKKAAREHGFDLSDFAEEPKPKKAQKKAAKNHQRPRNTPILPTIIKSGQAKADNLTFALNTSMMRLLSAGAYAVPQKGRANSVEKLLLI